MHYQESHEAGDAGARNQAIQRSTWVSVGVNLLLTLAQLAAGLFAHSSALVADAMHSLSDLLADFVVLLANHHSAKPEDEDHHYGHRRYENAASLVLGVLLLAVGLGMLWNAAGKFLDPHALPQVKPLALYVALGSLLAKELLFRYMLAIAKRVGSSLLIANAWHARSDAASSLVVAVGIIGNMAGWTFLDPLAAALVGFMISRTGWEFSSEAFGDLTDRAVSADEQQAIRAEIATVPGVVEVHDMRMRRMGDLALVDVHIVVPPSISVSEGHQIAALARQRVLAAHPVLNVTVHVDSDLSHAPVRYELPMRPELEARLNRALGRPLLDSETLQLHYAPDGIHAVLLLPAADSAALPALQAALAAEADIVATRVYLRPAA
ncbi:cation diffusion facilitator family transporter [Pseudogulbenkiania ferrooxidans]|uniref:Cation diffusion facilitator family transporter n=1 Tax=Pseudogulbenkiania ferrooxidans 2002 TaxID=279714 RepID=B9Z6M6_9NEIS|nr:cation diffusion facilitator family transporter [Pseudogulbenkiania ferrooxidans]EEG07601.1 cation diffusion facilitator family transporter [Pseudogulbenkiania ferrooxidans 2002]